jgi:hypothetical protein
MKRVKKSHETAEEKLSAEERAALKISRKYSPPDYEPLFDEPVEVTDTTVKLKLPIPPEENNTTNYWRHIPLVKEQNAAEPVSADKAKPSTGYMAKEILDQRLAQQPERAVQPLDRKEMLHANVQNTLAVRRLEEQLKNDPNR